MSVRGFAWTKCSLLALQTHPIDPNQRNPVIHANPSQEMFCLNETQVSKNWLKRTLTGLGA
jgi:hypothetical protein